VVTTLVCFIYFAREAAGASGTRLSLRPPTSRASLQNSGATRGEKAESYLWVGVIPGRERNERARNLEIPGSALRAAPE